MWIDCFWYISAPEGQQVGITWQGIASTSEYFNLYDHPTSYQDSYRVTQIYAGNWSSANLDRVFSSRGGLVLFYEDKSTGPNGKGFIVDFSSGGKRLRGN